MYLGIDPGRDKTGWAMVNKDGELLASGVIRGISHSSLAEILEVGDLELFKKSSIEGSLETTNFPPLEALIVGKGTTSNLLAQELLKRGVTFILVDETDTTLLARDLYWKIHKPGLLRRIFPFLLQLPPRDLDDLAAWQIVIRYVENLSQ